MFDNENIVSHNAIVKNVFSSDQIDLIYSCINLNLDKDLVLQPDYGRLYIPLYWRQITNLSGPIGLKINETIVDSIIEHSSKFSNVQLQIESISFARYSAKYGIPFLFPHTDSNYKESRLTFDIQLDSNVEWPIVVEHQEYLLANNDAIVFSGTHDVHWRSKQLFKNDDYVDILLCQLSKKTDSPKQLNVDFMRDIMIKQKVLKVKYDKGLI